MPFLEIVHITGDVDRWELTKQQPVTIGSHSSNDIRIDEDGVEIMHCRISWGKKGFEAVAAGVEGIDVDGTQMQRAVLKPGCILRFGTVDVRYRDGEEDPAAAGSNGSDAELGLKPISGEFPLREERTAEPQPPPSPPPASRQESKASPPPPAKKHKPASAPKAKAKEEEPEEDFDLLSGLDALAEESLSSGSMPTLKQQKKKKESGRKKPAPPKPNRAPAEEEEEEEETAPASAPLPRSPSQPAAAPKVRGDVGEDDQDEGLSSRLRDALRAQQRRPGEEDPLRSPLVLSLAGGALALMLTGAIFFFIAGRQTTQQRFDAAKAYYDEGNYRSAISAFDDFIVLHRRDDLAREAEKLRGLAQVRQFIEGGSPNYPGGLEQLRAFINDERDQEDFETLHPEITAHARTVSLGAAVAAGRRFEPPLLETAREARTVLRTYAPKDAPPTETLQQIERALRASEASILKNGVYKEHLATIEAALEEQAPLKALKLRRDLLVRYPDFERDRNLVALQQKTLELERRLVVFDETDVDALTDDHETPQDLLTLAFQGRTRTDEVAVGRAVVVLAKDCCYGVEFVTGEPLWRRPIGLDSPFFPLTEPNLPSIILFDTSHQELIRLNQTSGELIWRQPLGESVSGQPLLTGDTLYVSTEGGRLLALDVGSGAIVGQLTFSQPITGPVELSDQQRLVVVGHEEAAYTLTRRPFACAGVSYLGQQPGSVEAPLLTMGSYLLMIENRSGSATLRLIETETGERPLFEVANARVGGRVVDTPVIRGRDLFVPSTGERVSAFSISDDPGQPPLTPVAVFQGEGDHRGPIYLMTGPDRQVWMATGALARLRLTTDSLQPDGDSVAPGFAAQPLTYVSGYLMNARRRPYNSAVTFTRTDRDALTSDWQTVVGGEILAWTSRTGDSLNLAAVNEAGHAFRIGERQLSEGRFLKTATERLPVNQNLVDPLLAAAVVNDRIAVACGDPEPRMWLINAAGQIEGSPLLPSPPQAPPSSIGDRVIVPLPGRIHTVRLSGQPAVQDFALPTGDEQTWVNVVRAGEDKAVAVTAEGLVLLLKLESSPRPHLGEVARVELGQQILHAGSAGEGLFAVSDGSRKVSVFDSDRLDPRGARVFEEPVSNRTWIAGGKLFVEEGAGRLHCIDPQSALPSVWTLELHSSSVAGIVAKGETFVIAQQNGTVRLIERESGQLQQRHDLKTPLSNGPIVVQDHVFVCTIDGTLIRLAADPETSLTKLPETP